jgi:flagellar biogenesis protein FliO
MSSSTLSRLINRLLFTGLFLLSTAVCRAPLQAQSALQGQPSETSSAPARIHTPQFDPLAIPVSGPQTTSDATGTQQTDLKRSNPLSLSGSLSTVTGALSITLALFAVFAFISRKATQDKSGRILPREAMEVIGFTPLGPKQKLVVVRCGVQAVILGMSPSGMHTVAQFDDPDEAGQFIAQCRGLGNTAAFRTTLREMEAESNASGFIDNGATNQRRSKLFLRA